MVNKVANYTLQIHGANGINGDLPIERYFRDARVNEIIEGSSQMHEIVIAHDVLKRLIMLIRKKGLSMKPSDIENVEIKCVVWDLDNTIWNGNSFGRR